MKLIVPKSGDEHDGLFKSSKRYYNWGAGIRKYIKRTYNKRVRRLFKKDTLENKE